MSNFEAIQALKKNLRVADRNMTRAIRDNDLNEARRYLAIRDRYNTALKNEYAKNETPHGVQKPTKL